MQVFYINLWVPIYLFFKRFIYTKFWQILSGWTCNSGKKTHYNMNTSLRTYSSSMVISTCEWGGSDRQAEALSTGLTIYVTKLFLSGGRGGGAGGGGEMTERGRRWELLARFLYCPGHSWLSDFFLHNSWHKSQENLTVRIRQTLSGMRCV